MALWISNRQRDSLELLNSPWKAVPKADVHGVSIAYFDDERKLGRYNGSKTRDAIENRGGKNRSPSAIWPTEAPTAFKARIWH